MQFELKRDFLNFITQPITTFQFSKDPSNLDIRRVVFYIKLKDKTANFLNPPSNQNKGLGYLRVKISVRPHVRSDKVTYLVWMNIG